jgi:hypothetical protein
MVAEAIAAARRFHSLAVTILRVCSKSRIALMIGRLRKRSTGQPYLSRGTSFAVVSLAIGASQYSLSDTHLPLIFGAYF